MDYKFMALINFNGGRKMRFYFMSSFETILV